MHSYGRSSVGNQVTLQPIPDANLVLYEAGVFEHNEKGALGNV